MHRSGDAGEQVDPLVKDRQSYRADSNDNKVRKAIDRKTETKGGKRKQGRNIGLRLNVRYIELLRAN